MIIFNSKEKDRNYHRSKKKYFNHQDVKGSKQKIIFIQQSNNRTNNLLTRAHQPSKQSKGQRSPSKNSQHSKNSVFSDKDKMMTKQMLVYTKLEYNLHVVTSNQRKNLKSPDDVLYHNQKIKVKTSEQRFKFQRRSKQTSKQEQCKRKMKFPKLFQNCADPYRPTRTPPRSPHQNFMQQQGRIDPISVKQAQQLQVLREQNEFYKLIYKASLDKMKRLENSIENEKKNYKISKEQFQKELKDLKNKVLRSDKKISFGHLYHYDLKDTLKVEVDQIIPQTDNEASQITRYISEKQKKRNKQDAPSRLSIEST